MRTCTVCNVEIPAGRLLAVPDTTTCVEHADVPLLRGAMVWDHKTAPELVVGKAAEYVLQNARRGFHAQLPLTSMNNPRTIASVKAAELHSAAAALIRGEVDPDSLVDFVRVDVKPARCHPDQPRVNPAGQCVECALAWYKR